ncbi:MAG: alginate export family protein [Cyanobacteriota bacterium]|nr:alginate export family protein [Cyanobacteriota bacterium]
MAAVLQAGSVNAEGVQDTRIAQVEIPANPEMPAAPSPTLQLRQAPWTVTIGLFTGSQLVLEDNTFWGLSEVFAPTAAYNPDRVWNEAWLIPSLRVDLDLAPALKVYGAVAPAATGTLGNDLFEQGNSGEVSLENAFGGVRLGGKTAGFTLDLSGGQQPYRLGTGFLIDLGAQNGNSRGALLVAPRRAWKSTAIARFSSGRLAADAFLLDFNAITSSDPATTLWGTKLELGLTETPSDERLGLAYLQVTESTMPYISAPLTIIENGRKGTQVVNPYLHLRPLRRSLPGLTTALEGAYQWNNDITLSSWAVSAEVGHQWRNAPLMPRLSYAFRQYSGDNPATATLERFDPLFYDGGVYAFASGSNAALTFYNTNVLSHRLALSLSLSPKDLLTLSYWRVSAAQLNSPLQFGQGGRLVELGGQPVLISGVPAHHLSDDLYLEYVRSLFTNTYLTLGVGVSFPGKGLMEAGGGTLNTWLGGLMNLTVTF